MTSIPQADRDKIDPAAETLAHEMARTITVNRSTIPVFRHTLVAVAGPIIKAIEPTFALALPAGKTTYAAAYNVGEAILRAAVTYGAPADGTALDPLRYAVVRLMQRVPQIKVERDDWRHSRPSWLSPMLAEALALAGRDTEEWGIGAAGVFADALDEWHALMRQAHAAPAAAGDVQE